MSLTRRGFLIGAGSLITATYVSDAKYHMLDTGEPLIAQPLNPQRIIHAYPDMGDTDGSSLLSLGEYLFEPPDVTWREYLSAQGYRFTTQDQLNMVLNEFGIEEAALAQNVCDFEDTWEYSLTPSIQARRFLSGLDLGPLLNGGEPGTVGSIDFTFNMAGDEWVQTADDLSLSLLQARLEELGLPVTVNIGDPS